MREWFGEMTENEARVKILELMVLVRGSQHGQSHELVACDSLGNIIDEIKRRTNSPFIPEDASFWICPEGRVHDGTFVSIIGGVAIYLNDQTPTLEDVRLRIAEPNLTRKEGVRTFHTMIAEFGETHAFLTTRPPRERSENDPRACSYQLCFKQDTNDSGYTPKAGHKAYALITTRGAGPQDFTILYHATIDAFHDENPISVHRARDRELVYTIRPGAPDLIQLA